MTLKSQVESDIKTALLAGERDKAEVLRGLKAAVLNEEVATGTRDSGLDDTAFEKVVTREVKKRRESAALYRQNDREDLAETEEQEAAILGAYLPEQLDETAIREAVVAVIKQTGAGDIKAMGKVIGAVKSKHGAAVDGALLARIAKEVLSD